MDFNTKLYLMKYADSISTRGNLDTRTVNNLRQYNPLLTRYPASKFPLFATPTNMIDSILMNLPTTTIKSKGLDMQFIPDSPRHNKVLNTVSQMLTAASGGTTGLPLAATRVLNGSDIPAGAVEVPKSMGAKLKYNNGVDAANSFNSAFSRIFPGVFKPEQGRTSGGPVQRKLPTAGEHMMDSVTSFINKNPQLKTNTPSKK